MRNILLTIQYDGTHYHGWQFQKNANSITNELLKSIYAVTGESVLLHGSGRTDTGVHALGQKAHFLTGSRVPISRFPDALNVNLPRDIVVVDAIEMPLDFHSRYHAKTKTYEYLIHNGRYPSPLTLNKVWYVRKPLSVERMIEAVKYFEGEHDFTAFMSAGSYVERTVRVIHHASLEEQEGLLHFEISGNGFLYNMVRIMAGTLVFVGLGKLRPDDIPKVLESKDRRQAGMTAPACGLYLKDVIY